MADKLLSVQILRKVVGELTQGDGCSPGRVEAFFGMLDGIPAAIDTDRLQELSDTLQAYLDTGYTPGQIRELKERDAAQAPIDINEDYGFFTCSSCGEAIYVSDNFKSHKFCLNCGQRIRWEE